MRMRKKKNLEARLEAVGDMLFISDSPDRNFNTAVIGTRRLFIILRADKIILRRAYFLSDRSNRNEFFIWKKLPFLELLSNMISHQPAKIEIGRDQLRKSYTLKNSLSPLGER